MAENVHVFMDVMSISISKCHLLTKFATLQFSDLSTRAFCKRISLSCFSPSLDFLRVQDVRPYSVLDDNPKLGLPRKRKGKIRLIK